MHLNLFYRTSEPCHASTHSRVKVSNIPPCFDEISWRHEFVYVPTVLIPYVHYAGNPLGRPPMNLVDIRHGLHQNAVSTMVRKRGREGEEVMDSP